MQLFYPYKVRPLPTDDARRDTINSLLRLLEGSSRTHVLLKAKEGSGRRTVANAVASLGKGMGRRHILRLDTGALSTALYEAFDTTELFESIRQSAKSYQRGLVLVESPDLLIDGVERYEVRRLVRFFTELLEPHDIRCLIVATDDQALQLRNLSPSLKKLLSVIEVPPLTAEQTRSILAQTVATDLAAEAIDLAVRFYPHRGLPGGAIRLLADAQDVASQKKAALAVQDVQAAVARQRNLPLSAISTTDLSDVRELADQLGQRVLGQDHALATVTKVIQRSHVGLASRTKPIASFLFLGPSGVGKTELAKSLADLLFHTERAFTRLDMSEFSESHTVQRLIGAPPGYVGYEEGGQLTNPVDQEPYSLVLLDEIEKAHPKVFDTFLQLLDDGRLTDGKGKTVDFRHTIVIATSNIGVRQIIEAAETGMIHDRDRFLRSALLPLLVEHFRPEFLNRFDAIIAFSPLLPDRLAEIGRMQIDRLAQRLAEQSITLSVSTDTLAALAERAYQPTFGARPLRRLIAEEIETPIAEQIVAGTLKSGQSISF